MPSSESASLTKSSAAGGARQERLLRTTLIAARPLKRVLDAGEAGAGCGTPLPYSTLVYNPSLRTALGCTRAARRAGSQLAVAADTTSTAAAPANKDGSLAVSPNSSD